MTSQKSIRNRIIEYAQQKYGTTPEYLWARYPEYAVLRRADNKKWYGVIMNVPRDRLGLGGDGIVDVLNVKCPVGLYELVRNNVNGILRGYHMGGTWVSVLLDGTVEISQVIALLDTSYTTVQSSKRSRSV